MVSPAASLFAEIAAEPFILDESAPYLRNAFHLARIARLVYAGDSHEAGPKVEVRFPELFPFRDAFSDRLHFSRGRIEGLVACNDTHVVVAFRGTEQTRDWAEFVQYTKTDGYGGRVHEGIAKALDGVWNYVLAAFYDARSEDKTIWVTGHSLGGALATLAAQRMHEEGFEPHMTTTFGAPAIFDEQGADNFEPKLYRFVNDEDVIPQLSWPRLFDAYHHVGEEIFLLRRGDVAEDRYPPHLAQKFHRAMNIDNPVNPTGPLKDHLMIEYVQKLATHLLFS